MLCTAVPAWQAQYHVNVNAVKQEYSDEDSSDDDDFLAPPKKVQKQGLGATAGTSGKPKLAGGEGGKGSNAVAQPAKARPALGSSRPPSAEGSKAAGPSRPAPGGANKSRGASRPSSGGSGNAAGQNPAAKPSRPLVASTTKVCSRVYELSPVLDELHEAGELVPGCDACRIWVLLLQHLQLTAGQSVCC